MEGMDILFKYYYIILLYCKYGSFELKLIL